MPRFSIHDKQVTYALLGAVVVFGFATVVLVLSGHFPQISPIQRWEPIPAPITLPLPLSRVALEVEPHPRMFFSGQDIPSLRNQAQSSHQEIWAPIFAFAQSQLNSTPPAPPSRPDLDGYRNAGNAVIDFAFTYVITGDNAYLDLTRRYLLAYTRWQNWGDENEPGDRDLGFHHMLLGNSLAYDWVFNDLSDADRATISASLAQRAQESYEASTSKESRWSNWWRRAYTQNHHWTNHSALGIAALVLEGQDDRAQQWLNDAIDNLKRDQSLAEGIADGSWHEGIAYQSYELTMSLPFLYNLRRLKTQDLFPRTYLRNYVDWRVYNSLPGSRRFVLSFGDFEWNWANAYGPEGILRFAAREYRDGHAEWIAQQIVNSVRRNSSIYSAPWYVFEFLYYDPTVQAQPPNDPYPNRTFSDLEGVIWRGGWTNSDLVFGLKTGAPGGRYAFDRFTNGKQYPYDPKSSADLFHTGHDHDDANSFYLYRGGVDLASERVGYQLTGTEYHNTLLVDGQGQYRVQDSAPGAGTDPNLVQGTDGGLGSVYGTKDFSYLAADASHRYRYTDPKTGRAAGGMVDEFRRYVLFVKPGYLVMVDNIKAGLPHGYEWVSHFGGPASIEGDWLKGAGDQGQLLGIKVVGPSEFSTSFGNDGKPYVRLRPTSQVANTRFVTVLYPTDEAGWQNRPEITSLGDDEQVSGVRVLQNGTQDHLFRHGDQGEVSVGEYSFDGQVASVERSADGSLQRVFLGGGSNLSDNGVMLVQSPAKVQAVQADYQGAALAVYGDNLGGVSLYGPGVDAGQVTVNGELVAASMDGDYVILPPSSQPNP